MALFVVVTAADTVPDIITESVELGISAGIVILAGFNTGIFVGGARGIAD